MDGLSHCGLDAAGQKPRRDALGFTRAAEDSALKRIKPMRGREKTKALFVADHDVNEHEFGGHAVKGS